MPFEWCRLPVMFTADLARLGEIADRRKQGRPGAKFAANRVRTLPPVHSGSVISVWLRRPWIRFGVCGEISEWREMPNCRASDRLKQLRLGAFESSLPGATVFTVEAYPIKRVGPPPLQLQSLRIALPGVLASSRLSLLSPYV